VKIDVVDSRDRKARKIRADIKRKIWKLGKKGKEIPETTVSNKV